MLHVSITDDSSLSANDIDEQGYVVAQRRDDMGRALVAACAVLLALACTADAARELKQNINKYVSYSSVALHAA